MITTWRIDEEKEVHGKSIPSAIEDWHRMADVWSKDTLMENCASN